jgi:hypothetical protein
MKRTRQYDYRFQSGKQDVIYNTIKEQHRALMAAGVCHDKLTCVKVGAGDLQVSDLILCVRVCMCVSVSVRLCVRVCVTVYAPACATTS